MMELMVQRLDQDYPQQLRFCSTVQPFGGTVGDRRAYETCMATARNFGASGRVAASRAFLRATATSSSRVFQRSEEERRSR